MSATEPLQAPAHMLSGPGKHTVTVTIDHRLPRPWRDTFVRYSDPEDRDPENRTTTAAIEDAYLNPGDELLTALRDLADPDIPAEAARVVIRVDGRVVLDEWGCDTLGVIGYMIEREQ